MRSHPHFWAYVALISVCFFWGTTYLAIRMALESFPPLTLVAIRFVLSGSVMLAVFLIHGAHLPRGGELWRTALYGVVALGGGNGCLTYSELWIPSGLAALIITTSPFWLVGIEALAPAGERLHLPAVIGMAVGLLGAVMLMAPGSQEAAIDGVILKGFLLLQAGNCAWALGSIAQRRQPTQAHPVVGGAVQQLAAGVACAIPALLIQQHPVRWSVRGVSALFYLVVFGSIVGYSAYVYALDRLPVALVSVYTYVNPVVAVALGWLFYREPFGWRETVAMAVIFVGVTVVKRYSPARRTATQVAETP